MSKSKKQRAKKLREKVWQYKKFRRQSYGKNSPKSNALLVEEDWNAPATTWQYVKLICVLLFLIPVSFGVIDWFVVGLYISVDKEIYFNLVLQGGDDNGQKS